MADRLHKIHLLSRYLAGELSPNDQQAVADHLKICAVCQQELHLLHQTMAALQALPLEETSSDFVERLNARIDQEAELRHPKEQQQPSSPPVGSRSAPEGSLPSSGLGKPPLAILAQKVPSWRRLLCVLPPIKISLSAGVAVLGLVALLLWRVPSEQATVPPAPPATLAPLSPVPLPQRTASVADETLPSVDTGMSATEKFPTSVAPRGASTDTSSIVASLMWRVVGNEPTALHEQVKALVKQLAGAVIVKEENYLLLIALPTRELPAFHQELSKIGEVSALEAEITPGTSTTLLQVTFVQRLAVFHSARDRLASHSSS